MNISQTLYEFQRSDGLTIRGKLYAQAGETRQPLVIFGHAFGGSYKDIEWHGEAIAREGIACLLIDYCGGGKETTSDGAWEDMTPMTVCEDMETVVSQIARVPEADPDRVFLMGGSLGGLASALVAARCGRKIRGIILWYPALSFPDKVRRTFPDGNVQDTEFLGCIVTRNYYASVLDLDAYAEAERYTGPVLIIQGDKDDIVPPESSERMAARYQNAQLVMIPGAGHGFDERDAVTAREAAVRFIKEQLSDHSPVTPQFRS